MYVNLEYGDNSVLIEQFRSLGRFSVIVTGKSANKIIFISNSTETNAPTGPMAIAKVNHLPQIPIDWFPRAR